MERENKYLVIKNADIEKHLSDEQQLAINSLITKIRVRRMHEGKVDQSYVVVAADWPMYEKVWGMIAAYVDGYPNELEKLEAENATLREQLQQANLAVAAGTSIIEDLKGQLADQQSYATTRADEMLGATRRIAALEKQLAAAQKDAELIGVARESGVVWFNKNPHAFPVGTKFYAAIEKENE